MKIALSFAPSVTRSALHAALGLAPDPNPPAVCEIGRPATGATCALVHDADGFSIEIPTLRAPWSGADLLPTVTDAVRRLGGSCAPADALDAWHRQRAVDLAELRRLCAEQGAPPPPTLDAGALAALHGWLVAEAGDGPAVALPVFVFDAKDGSPCLLATRLPHPREAALVRLLPVGHVLCDLDARPDGGDEAPRLYPLACIPCTHDARGYPVVDVALARCALKDAPSEALDRFRLASPVEVVERESIAS